MVAVSVTWQWVTILSISLGHIGKVVCGPEQVARSRDSGRICLSILQAYGIYQHVPMFQHVNLIRSARDNMWEKKVFHNLVYLLYFILHLFKCRFPTSSNIPMAKFLRASYGGTITLSLTTFHITLIFQEWMSLWGLSKLL